MIDINNLERINMKHNVNLLRKWRIFKYINFRQDATNFITDLSKYDKYHALMDAEVYYFDVYDKANDLVREDGYMGMHDEDLSAEQAFDYLDMAGVTKWTYYKQAIEDYIISNIDLSILDDNNILTIVNRLDDDNELIDWQNYNNYIAELKTL